MNENLYTLETYSCMKKDAKKGLVISLVLFLIGLTLFFLSYFLITPANVQIMKVVDSLVLIIFLASGAYIFIHAYALKKIRSRFIYRLLTVERFEGRMVIKDIKKPYLVRKWVKAYEIEAIDDEGKNINVYYEYNQPLNFQVGDELEVVLAMNFIVAIKEINHEASH